MVSLSTASRCGFFNSLNYDPLSLLSPLLCPAPFQVLDHPPDPPLPFLQVLDQQATGSVIRFFDTAQGRPVGEPFSHTLEIKEVALSQVWGRVTGGIRPEWSSPLPSDPQTCVILPDPPSPLSLPLQTGTSAVRLPTLNLPMCYPHCPPSLLPPSGPQTGTSADRQLIFIDRNRDMYIMPVMKRTVAKLASMVDSVFWHDSTGMLSAIIDQKLVGKGGA